MELRNSLLPTVAQFRTDFPQFSDDTRFPNAQIQFRLNLADRQISQQGKESLYAYMVELYIAHYLYLWDKDRRSSALGGAGGANNGVINSKSVDKVSMGYDTGATLNPDAGFWNNSRYGSELYEQIIQFGAGGRQL